ncbi:MAG: hypothetical protein JO285_04075, partial [Kutzneria sp.]|nr:hypothetical protein [Kutzneria sp.]
MPPDTTPIVQGVIGLDDDVSWHKLSITRKAGTPDGYGPAQLRGAYDTGSLGTGAGVAVALSEFDGYQQTNVSTDDSQFGLTPPQPRTVSVDGANYDGSPGEGQNEVELDIEVVQAMAPAASTYVYEAPDSGEGEVDMINKIVTTTRSRSYRSRGARVNRTMIRRRSRAAGTPTSG